MSDWPTRTIKQSSYLKGRIGWQGLRAEEFLEEGPFLITGTDFVGGQIDWSDCYHISEWRFREAAYIHVKDGDLLITKDGTIGKVVLVRDCPEQAVLNSGIFLLRCKDGSYDHKFCYYVLTSEIFEEFLRKNLNGSTINHLYQNVFERFEVPIPDQLVQERIGDMLEVIDQAIEKTEALIEKYQQIKAGLMHDLFTRGIGPDGKLRPPREQAPELYQETPIGWIPKEWGVVSLNKISDVVRGSTPRPAKDPRYFDGNYISWITVGELSREDWPYLNSTRTMLTEIGVSFSRLLEKRYACNIEQWVWVWGSKDIKYQWLC